jgi:uncharacterized membrane protein
MSNLNKWTKVLGVVLVLSLALNFFLAGWMGARMMHAGPGHDRWSIMRLVRDLPEDQRGGVLAIFEAHRDQIRGVMDSMRETRREVADILMAEPYDAAAAARALAELRAESAAMQESMHAALLEAAAELPPEARVDLGRFATMSRMH